VQKSLDTLLLRVGTSETVSEASRLEMTRIITEAMGYPFDVQFEQLEQIPRGHNGKYEEFLSELTDA
jgi:hypothetical protein